MNRRTVFLDLAAAFSLVYFAVVTLAEAKAPGPLGLPSVITLRRKLVLSDLQTEKVRAIYAENKERAQVVEEKGDAHKVADVRQEIVGRIREVCTLDQQMILDTIVPAKPGSKPNPGWPGCARGEPTGSTAFC